MLLKKKRKEGYRKRGIPPSMTIMTIEKIMAGESVNIKKDGKLYKDFNAIVEERVLQDYIMHDPYAEDI